MATKSALLAITCLLPGWVQAPPKDALREKVKTLIDSVNREDNPDIEFPGEGFLDLPQDALPFLKEALKRKDLLWTARTSIAKGIVKINQRTHHLVWDPRFEGKKEEFQRLLVGEYKRVSRRDPAWDQLALKAVEAAFENWGQLHLRTEEAARKARDSARIAIQAGCDDPLVLYIAARGTMDFREGTAEDWAQAHAKAAKALDESKYHPVLRCRGHRATAEILVSLEKDPPTGERNEEILQHAHEAVRAFSEAIETDKALTLNTLVYEADELIDLSAEFEDRKKAFDLLFAAAENGQPSSAFKHILAGSFFKTYAWDARGTKWASQVKPEAWEIFGERLRDARSHLTSAWKIDPTVAEVPKLMLGVVLGDYTTLDEMELWFTRGMELRPDYYSLCTDKLYFLEPRWHGTPEKMLRFGRQCALTGNWEAGVPWTLLDAHERIAHYTENGWQRKADYTYFRKPGVWKDVQALYARYLTLYPNSDAHRATYAFYAGNAQHWKEANEAFDRLGESPSSYGAFGSKESYTRARTEAREHPDHP